MTYGFDLPADLHRQLRGEVPEAALRWVEEQTGRRVVTAEPLDGGQSAALHRLTVSGADGEDVDSLVLQRFVLDWIDEEPWAPRNELLAFELLENSPVPAPRTVAADPDGLNTGSPMVLMSALPGEVIWDPPELDRWLSALLQTMITIHRTPRPATMRDWSPYPPEEVPPTWTRHRWAWERAITAYEGDRPPSERVFLHRDFHPGNVLWQDGSVSGVVDWVSACAGPPEEDVALCRIDLARRHGQPVADRFLDLWLQATGRREYDPYWDLVTAVSMGGDPHPRLDEFVRSAAARL
ncbi:aminoglycoside phosphotransferase family protein [Microlunatus elymi]|uniref:Aminoglycoside phosphotransferase family protein n=1 Tax=Microlunatus elymi TaxID=2596828 RepID=A0A516PU60_9ACTN|nr:aminoglycoside phosphotransferase family protein [Microlunatus elymi]QDP94679.1 aminoglycoside phosphotransferase family protein [Microlunatus elymi]